MAYLYAWTTASPVLTDLVHDGAQEIREGVKAALNERIQSVVANIDNDPWQFKNIQAAVNNTYDIGTITSRFKAGYVNALAVNIGVVPSAGNILLANTGVVQSRNAAGLANLNMLSMNASDVLQLYNGAATLTSVGVMTATTFVGNLTGNADTATSVSGNAATATKLLTARTINGVSFDGTANIIVSAATVGTLTFGTHLTSGAASFSGANATISSDATNLNTISTIVARDGSGNFSAGTITAALTGNVTGNCSGTAATVTTAAQPAITSVGTLTGLTVTATITGSVSGSAATVTTAAQPAITSVGTLTSLAVTGAITAGTFGGVTMSSGAVSGITTLAGTGAVSGFTTATFSSTFLVSGGGVAATPTSTFNGLRLSGGDTGNTIYNGARAIAITADSGTSIHLATTSLGGTVGLSVSTTNGNVNVWNGFTVSGTTAVQALTATSVISKADLATYSEPSAQVRALGATDANKQVVMGINTTANVGFVQAVQFGTGNLELKLNPNGGTVSTGGALSVGAGISCTTGTFSGGAGGASITMPATGRFYIDGGGDTYITESSANFMEFFTGATSAIQLNNGVFQITVAQLATTASAANAFVSSVTGQIFRSTSSIRYKSNVQAMTYEEAANVIFNGRAVTYQSRCSLDDPSERYVGFIAEEMADVNKSYVHFANGRAEGVQYERFVVPMVLILQDHEKRLVALEGK